jgi:hypothetical protein
MPRKRRKLMFDRAVLPDQSLRKQERKLWERLRKRLLGESNGCCTACGRKPPEVSELEAHEVYSYPGKGIVRLKEIVLLCRTCHHAVHLERSISIASTYVGITRKAERERLLTHYCKVNGVTRQQAERDWEKAIPPYVLKKLDVGPYEGEAAMARERRSLWKIWNSFPKRERGDFRTFCDEHADELDAYGFEFLPDCEYPEATAMWRDTFRKATPAPRAHDAGAWRRNVQ